MPKTYQKRPSFEEFSEVCEKFQGNKSNIARALGVTRRVVCYWCAKYPKYAEVVEEQKGRLLDRCLKSAEALALGIPETKVDPKTGKEVRVGWKEKPDGFMLRYLIGTLGRREGFGESLDITSKGESIKPDQKSIDEIKDEIKRIYESITT